MSAVRYTVDNVTFGFSMDSIRRNYASKDSFVNDMTKAYPDVDAKKLKKVLENVWGGCGSGAAMTVNPQAVGAYSNTPVQNDEGAE